VQPTDFIACDAGTTDAGPFSLGMGVPAFPREAVKRDLSLMFASSAKGEHPCNSLARQAQQAEMCTLTGVLEIVREIVAGTPS